MDPHKGKIMTVADLILKLSEFPSDMEVWVRSEDWEPLWDDEFNIYSEWVTSNSIIPSKDVLHIGL